MAGYIGNLALFFSLIFNGFLIFSLIKGIRNNDFKNSKIINFFNNSIFYLLLISFLTLIYCFVVSDFSNVAVYQNSHTTKPLIYKISGAWGNHEGSMVLFILILSLFSFVFARTKVSEKLKFYTVFFQSILILIFLIFLIFTSNPFDQMDPKPIPTVSKDQGRIIQKFAILLHDLSKLLVTNPASAKLKTKEKPT